MRALGKFWLAVLILLPVLALLVLPPFEQRMVILVGIYALLGVGYQLVFGRLGALNLAQGALFGVGAYTVALTAPTLGLLSLPVAILAAALPAAIVASPILRLQSHYFALATLALASLIHLAAVHVESITGGANGLAGFTALLPRGPILLVIVWICLILTIVVQARLFAGPMGERARLLREAPLVAATLGIDGGRWRLVAFVIGSALAGLAGGLSAAVSGVVSPEITGFPIMVLCLTSVVLGGARHPMGAVLGAVIAVCLPELLRDLQGAWLLAYAAATPAGRALGARRARCSDRSLAWRPTRATGIARNPGAPGVRRRAAAAHPRWRCQALRRRRGLAGRVVHTGAWRGRRPDRRQRIGQDDASERDRWTRKRRWRHDHARRSAVSTTCRRTPLRVPVSVAASRASHWPAIRAPLISRVRSRPAHRSCCSTSRQRAPRTVNGPTSRA